MEQKKNPDKDIHRQSRMFFQIGLCISVALVITAFEWRTEVSKAKPRVVETKEDQIVLIPVTEQRLKEPPIPSPIKNEILKPVNPSIISSDPITPNNSTSYTPPIIDQTLLSSLSIKLEVDSIEACEDCIEVFPEQKAEPIGGYGSFYQFVQKNIKYPQKARKVELEGRVFIEFIVNKNGTPTDFKIIKGIGGGCDEEAQRVISLTKWNPGKQRGKPVRVKMVLPIQYKLN